ncbi:MAG: hypothetical protein Q7U28_09305 [Aquabacterium sp.]|nr:hypothetical protein [Aquabacterium sp.]
MNLGIGMLVGMASADEDARVAQYGQDLEAMRTQLATKRGSVVYQTAYKEATAAVHAEIVDELRLEAEGKLPIRRLSDPQNVDGRNKAFAEHAAQAIERISGGQMTLSSDGFERIRLVRPLK